jgi:hypothetical protein
METKHTAGAWKVRSFSTGSVGTENKMVAIVYGDDPDCELDERQRANARLISAAPELLEAVETLLDCFVNDPLGWMDSSDIAIEKAYDAIHKAKGE